ncbi:MAG: hypothetical protein ABF868_01300 [Sporolactobacillus sp.]
MVIKQTADPPQQLKHENGYVLLVVLMIITLTLIIMAALLGTALSHAQQISTVQSQTQATEAAEIGLKAMHGTINQDMGQLIAQNTTNPMSFNDFETAVNSKIIPDAGNTSTANALKSLQNGPNCTVTTHVVSAFDPSATPSGNFSRSCTVTLQSTGTAGTGSAQRTQTLSQNVTFTYSSQLPPVLSGDLGITNFPWTSNQTYWAYAGEFYFSNPFTLLSNVFFQYNGQWWQGNVLTNAVSNIWSFLKWPAQVQGLSSILQQFQAYKTYNQTSFPSAMMSNAAASGTLSNQTVAGNLVSTSGLSVYGSTTINGDVYVNGDLTISNGATLSVGGKLYVSGNLIVNRQSTATFNKFVWIDGNEQGPSGGAAAGGSLVFKDNVYVGGSVNRYLSTQNGYAGSDEYDGYVYVEKMMTLDAEDSGATIFFNRPVFIDGGQLINLWTGTYGGPSSQITTRNNGIVTFARGLVVTNTINVDPGSNFFFWSNAGSIYIGELAQVTPTQPAPIITIGATSNQPSNIVQSP